LTPALLLPEAAGRRTLEERVELLMFEAYVSMGPSTPSGFLEEESKLKKRSNTLIINKINLNYCKK
jgi:hypothetical protein